MPAFFQSDTMTTHLQTVDVYPADSSVMLQTLLPAPVFPSTLNRYSGYPDLFVSVTMDRYTLYPDGRIECLCANGDTQVWWPKPTLADAIAYSGKGTLFEFKSNGTVYARLGCLTYMWGPTNRKEQPLEGTQVCEDCFYSSGDPHTCFTFQNSVVDYDSDQDGLASTCKYYYRRYFQ